MQVGRVEERSRHCGRYNLHIGYSLHTVIQSYMQGGGVGSPHSERPQHLCAMSPPALHICVFDFFAGQVEHAGTIHMCDYKAYACTVTYAVSPHPRKKLNCDHPWALGAVALPATTVIAGRSKGGSPPATTVVAGPTVDRS